MKVGVEGNSMPQLLALDMRIMGYPCRSQACVCVCVCSHTCVHVCSCIVCVSKLCVNVAITVMRVAIKPDEEWAVFIKTQPIRMSCLVTRQAVKHLN